MARNLERAIARLESAGGEMSVAVQLVDDHQPLKGKPVIEQMKRVNIALSDIRRALVRLEHGDPVGEVAQSLEVLFRELFCDS